MQNTHEILSYDQVNPTLLNQVDRLFASAWPSYCAYQVELKINRIYKLFTGYQFITLTSDSKTLPL